MKRFGCVLWLAAGLAACAREANEPLPPRRLSLAEFASAARPVVETDRLDLGEATARPDLWSGWGGDEKGSDGTYVWAGADSSLLRLEVVEPRDRVLELRGWSYPFHDDPPQEVRLLLNGREIGSRLISVAPSLTRVAVAESLFRVGENYLELRYRRHHEQRGDDPWAAGWSDLALSDSRREATAAPGISARDGTIDLPTRTALEWTLELPADSWLAWGALESEGAARLVARVATEESDERVERRIDHGAGQLRLTRDDGRHHLISLSLASVGPNGRVRLRGAALHLPPLATPEAPSPAIVAAATPASRPNILVYLVDTLRADHLGCYGYSKPTSPEIDRFARQAVRWQEGRAQSSWTRPAVATILTGLQPITHGVQDSLDKLPRSVPLVSEMFRSAGWQTAMFTSNGNVASFSFGLARGWDFHRYFPERRRTPELHVQSAEMLPRVVDWLEHRDRSKPYLLVVHTTDPHDPYTPARRFRKRLAPGVRDREIGSRADISRLPAMPPAAAAKRRDDLMALYDAEIAGNDASFGKLMDYLDRAGLRDTTAVLLISDHGEEFFEHGGWTHGRSLYEEQLRVPFVLRLPGGRGAGTVVSADVAEQIDVVPTLLALSGLPVPKELPGRDLLATPSVPEREAAGRSSFAWLRRNGQVLDAVSRSQWKLVRNERAKAALHRPPRELYALGSDPGEQNDLARARPLRRSWLEGHLLAAWARFQRLLPAERVVLDPELEANLRALGYL